MSVLTEVILTCCESDAGCDDEANQDIAVKSLNRWLKSQGHNPLKRADDDAGDEKFMVSRVWLACFNKLDFRAFVNQLEASPWDTPESVRLFVNREHWEEHYFQNYPLKLSL